MNLAIYKITTKKQKHFHIFLAKYADI